LIGLSGEAAGRVVPLAEGLIIGRASTCHLRLTDLSVSRQHARLRYSQGRWYIQDMNSAGGTYVNGIRTSAAVLNNGDCIRIGSTEFEFRF
jgi:pSer/pThr/pTyr-binding forkhead associated (FHA) protein